MDANLKTEIEELNNKYKGILAGNFKADKNLQACIEYIFSLAGNAINSYPAWHPLLPIMSKLKRKQACVAQRFKTRIFTFTNGILIIFKNEQDFIETRKTLSTFNDISENAISQRIYKENAKSLLIQSKKVELSADRQIKNFDAVILATRHLLKKQKEKISWAEYNHIMTGSPTTVHSSVFVSEQTTSNLLKIYEALSTAGIYESEDKIEVKDIINNTSYKKLGLEMIKEAIKSITHNTDERKYKFNFRFKGYDCHAYIEIPDPEGARVNVRVSIVNEDLIVDGYFYSTSNTYEVEFLFGTENFASKLIG